jgi:PPOX class probable F420-dependent enzyme
MDDALEQFKRQQYLNLETFRKSGEGMKTPVWFVQDGETLYVSTLANSGKVKRIRNNGQVNVAACKMNGKVTGVWTPAQAREIIDPKIGTKVDRMLDKKYGLMKKLFDNQRTQKGTKGTILEIRLNE